MTEVLLAHGFIYAGFCAPCGNQMKKYIKVVNGKSAVAKIRMSNDRGMLTFNKKNFAINNQNIEIALTNNGLA